MALKNKVLKKLVNIPFILELGQDVLGANQLKREMYASVFDFNEHGSFLDFGCSYGNTTKIFQNFDYYGIDIDCQAIEAAQVRFHDQANIKFYCLDILKDDFKKDFFDHILFASTGHHLADSDLTQILEKLLINLKPGGQLHFFDIFQKPGEDRLVTRLLTRFDQGKYIRTLDAYSSLISNDKYQIDEWKIFKSPDKLIKLWDFLYARIGKSTN